MRKSNDQTGVPHNAAKGMSSCSCEYPSYPVAPYDSEYDSSDMYCDECGGMIRAAKYKDGASNQAARRVAATKVNKANGSKYG